MTAQIGQRFLYAQHAGLLVLVTGVWVERFYRFGRELDSSLILPAALIIMTGLYLERFSWIKDHSHFELITKLLFLAQSFCLLGNATAPWLALSGLPMGAGLAWLALSTHQEAGQTDLKRRYFAHDLVNHTVGMKLFLSTRSQLSSQDIALLLREVDLLQGLVSDHFQLLHKNIRTNRMWASLAELEHVVDHHLESFLRVKGVAATLEVTEGHRAQGHAEVYLPQFMRIVSNLIKNAADHEACQVEAKLDFSERGVVFDLRSQSRGVKGDEQGLAQHILQFQALRPTSSGLGLDSVAELVESAGGEFSFRWSDGTWVAQFSYPIRSKDLQKRQAA